VTIYRFSQKLVDWQGPEKKIKSSLGGKGAALTQMAKQGLNVPPGFTIPCETWVAFNKAEDKEAFIDSLMPEVEAGMEWLKEQFGFAPLVSVRSGAPISCPGMMDTILNVGLTGGIAEGNYLDWCQRIGDRPANDSRRRLIQMLGSTGYGVDMGVFDKELARTKEEFGAKGDTDLAYDQLTICVNRYLNAFLKAKGFAFPLTDGKTQLRVAIKAVFDSWMNPRAIEYRKINKIDEKMGTAVNVQAMVFGNMGDDSGTGVLFSRDPSTGEPGMMGEFLVNAQGEDVVAGIRTPANVSMMVAVTDMWNGVHAKLAKLCSDLEAAYKDMVDIEFTVQKGELFVLQSRTGKRSARAAFKIATDLVKEDMIDVQTALGRLSKEQFKVVRRPMIDPSFKVKPHLIGLPACPGVVSGKAVFTAEEAVACNEPCILVRHETDPDDIAGMAAAVGILTQTGGATSHAAVVARAMDKACVVGCTALKLPADGFCAKKVTIDGATGAVWFDTEVPVIDASDDPAVRQVMDWCLARLGAVEAAVVGLDGDKPHRVFAAHWWGSAEVAEAVVADLASCATVDVTAPTLLTPDEDNELLGAFGTSVENPTFGGKVAALVAKLAPHVTVVDGGAVPAMPADYAAFKVLAA
jgi:pyruvate,orthophosphate dikinase